MYETSMSLTLCCTFPVCSKKGTMLLFNMLQCASMRRYALCLACMKIFWKISGVVNCCNYLSQQENTSIYLV